MVRYNSKEFEGQDFSWQDLQGLSWIFNDEFSSEELKNSKSIACA